jgi:hypothetical protein
MREEIFGPRRYGWSGILRSVSGNDEAFGVSPGTFEQLQSTHVPAYKVVYM